MRTLRARPLAAAAAALLLIGSIAAHPAGADDGGLTRVRLTISTTSEWATARLGGMVVRAAHRVATSPGATVWGGGDRWTVVTPSGASASQVTIDLVLDIAPDARPHLNLTKGRDGVATVDVEVRNGPPAPAVHVDLSTHDPNRNEVERAVDPATLDAGGLAVAPIDHRRLTLAFYYPWFDASATQDPTIRPDRPVAPYATNDAGSVARMVDQAASAGIDGFVVSWEGAKHAGPVELLLQAVARRDDFAITPLIELRALSRPTLLGRRFDPAVAAAATRDFLARVPDSSRLEVDGRPVVLAFGMWDLSAQEWAAYRAQVADLDPFVVGDRATAEHPVDGFYEYDPNRYGADQLAARARAAVDQTRMRPLVDPTVPKRLWAATVSPGLDTTASQLLWNARRTPRDGGARYDMTWQVALGAEPDWVLVTSWNEWFEQTHVAAGTRTGILALEQTARWAQRFAATVPTVMP